MPLNKLNFRPGINRENTIYANEGGWYDMDKVRFRFGTPEKIGGWKQAVSGTFTGVARNIVCWASLKGEVMIGLGTHLKYYINYGGSYNNITPIRATSGTLTNPLTTTVNSAFVRVTQGNHGAVPGDYVSFSNASGFNGITTATINNANGYRVVSVIDSNTYTVNMGQVATGTGTAGGNVVATYELGAGLPVYTIGGGWGAGYWNGPITSDSIKATLAGTARLALNNTDTTVTVASTVGFTAVGSIAIDGEVITYTGLTSTTFTGCTRGAAGSTASNHTRRQNADGTFQPLYAYQVLGLSGTTGWGVAVDASFGIGVQMRLWSSATFGQDLIICPRGGTLYYWTKDLVTYNRAQSLYVAGDAQKGYVPQYVNWVIASDTSRFVLALGANGYIPGNQATAFDPMLVRWSAQNDPTNWIPTSTNQSGEIRLSAGSYIMSGVNTKQEMLVWTDAALYSLQYIGPPFVFRASLIMANLSLMGPNAFAVVNNTAFWMGADKFYKYDGKVDTLTCSIQQYIFNDISFAQRFQAFAGTNEGFNEVWWFYVSNTEVAAAAAASRDPTVDKYVIYNHNEDIWYFGTLNRSCWVDSPLYPGPLATTGADPGTMVMHEQGTDDGTSSTLRPVNAYIQSTDFDIGDGHQFMFVTRMLPDISFNGSVVSNPQCALTILPRQNSAVDYKPKTTDTVTSSQLYSTVVKQYMVQQYTPQIDVRLRGRQMAIRVESNTTGVQWKLGVPRIDVRPDGRKS